MRNQKKHAIFISHASEDRRLARHLQALLERTVQPRRRELVFCSSDVRAIPGGADWYDSIIRNLRASSVCLTLLTPHSIRKPWVLYESGGAYAIFQRSPDSRRLIAVLAGGITALAVPGPFQRLQARNLADSTEALELLRDVGRLLRRTVSARPDTVRTIVALASANTARWDTVDSLLASRRSDYSPFSVQYLLKTARKRIVIIGPNLSWVAESTGCHDQIIGFLRGGTGRHCQIVIADEKNKKTVAAWSVLNPALERAGYSHGKHLGVATKRFLALKARCRAAGARGFEIHVRDLVPLGATVVDPDETDGVIALTPLVNYGPSAADRPQFLIQKRDNRQVFDYYWRCFKDLLSHGKRL